MGMFLVLSLDARLKTLWLDCLLYLRQCLPERGFWSTIPWDALQIQGSVGQLTLGIITKLCLFLGDSGLTVTSRVNQTGRAEWHL